MAHFSTGAAARRTLIAAALLAGTAAWAQGANSAASYPTRPVNIITAFAVGSGPDAVLRIVGEKLTARLGQPIVIENRASAGGNNGTGAVAKSAGDGYTYLISTNGAQFSHPNKECLARIVRFGKPTAIYFNYASKFTKPWLTAAAQKKYGYKAIVRRNKDLSLSIAL